VEQAAHIVETDDDEPFQETHRITLAGGAEVEVGGYGVEAYPWELDR